MSARKAHAKSRSGCADCKRRRVKCDEQRPECRNCLKRGVRCSFHEFDPVPTSISSRTASPLIHVFSRQQSEDPKPPVSNILSEHTQQDLLRTLPEEERPLFEEVLRHFATNTVLTLSPGSVGQEAWRNAFPLFSKQHTFVLHGILALSALHLSRLAATDSDKEHYQTLAATQMNAGMVEYSQEIENISTANAEALLTFSTTLTTFTNYTASVECSEVLARLGQTDDAEEAEELTSKSLDAICRTFRSIRGVLVILVPCWQHIRAGILEPVVERDWWPPSIPTTPAEIERDKRLRKLENMWSCPGRPYEYVFDTFRAALKTLREAFALISRLDEHALPGDTSSPKTFDWTALFDWPVSLSLDFLSQLEQRRWEAWVIVAHYAVLMHKMTHHLWLENIGQNMLCTAALVIGEQRWDRLEWPASVIGVDLQSLRIQATS